MPRNRSDSSKVTARAPATRWRHAADGNIKLDPAAVRDFLDAYIVWRDTRPLATADIDRREHEAIRTLEFLADKGDTFREIVLSASQAVGAQLRAVLKQIFDMAVLNGAPQRHVVINTDGLLFAEICAALNRSSESGRLYQPPEPTNPAIEPLP